MVWDSYDCVFAEDDELGHHAVDGSAELWGILPVDAAGNPTGEHGGCDSVADRHTSDARADRHDFASAVRSHHNVCLHGQGIRAVQN
jgi:hypothetical protein